MDFTLDKRETAVVAALDDRFQAGIAHRAASADENKLMPAENWPEIVDSGYLRVFHPAGIGGTGLSGVGQARAMESLARACGGTYWSATMSALVCAKLISTYGCPVRHRPLVERLLSGESLACFAVVERLSGSDAGTYRTTVRRVGDDYAITGEKSRIANGPVADIAVVLARLQDAPHDADPGWCLAFVDLHQEGVHRYRLHGTGLRAMPWGGLVFEDVRVPKGDVVPVPYGQYAEGVAWGWLFISLSSIAIAESALSASIEHAREHMSFDRPLGHMESIQSLLADIQAEVHAARLMAWRAAWHRAAGRSVTDLIAMVKVYSTGMAVRATHRAIEIHGSWGLTRGRLIERLHRDAAMNVIGGFAPSRLREFVAERMGFPPSPCEPFDWLTPAGLNRDPLFHGEG